MRVRLLLLSSLLAVGLAACGGDDSSDVTDGSAATAVTIEAGDLFYSPVALEVSAAGFDITLENVGLVEHNLIIDEIGLEIYAAVGETVTETVVLSAGSYDYYCSIPGHREAGMQGVITAS